MHYLDHAATTPLLPEVRAAVVASFDDNMGNPSSVHAAGRAARAAVGDARERVAIAVGADPSEIAFTGGGTEAVNLAVKGAALKRRGNGDHIVVSAFEHHAVLHSADWLRDQGFNVTHVTPSSDGLVDPAEVAAAVGPRTVLVSVMAVNNEVGTIQPLAAISRAVRAVRPSVLMHTDAVQALGNIPVDVVAWGVDLASFAGHKLGAPKGVGALYVRSGVSVEPLVHGGGQEAGLRSGTQNVAGIVGFGIAAEISAKEVDGKAAALLGLRDRLLEGLTGSIPDLVVNGSLTNRVAGNVNVAFPGADADTMLLLLDGQGIACSSGSACASGATQASHVLKAMKTPDRVARASLRFSLGRSSSEADVDAVLRVLPGIVERARRAG